MELPIRFRCGAKREGGGKSSLSNPLQERKYGCGFLAVNSLSVMELVR